RQREAIIDVETELSAQVSTQAAAQRVLSHRVAENARRDGNRCAKQRPVSRLLRELAGQPCSCQPGDGVRAVAHNACVIAAKDHLRNNASGHTVDNRGSRLDEQIAPGHSQDRIAAAMPAESEETRIAMAAAAPRGWVYDSNDGHCHCPLINLLQTNLANPSSAPCPTSCENLSASRAP